MHDENRDPFWWFSLLKHILRDVQQPEEYQFRLTLWLLLLVCSAVILLVLIKEGPKGKNAEKELSQ